MTQTELAEELKVTQASVSRWEQDQLSMEGKNLVKIAKYFCVSADELLGLKENKTIKIHTSI